MSNKALEACTLFAGPSLQGIDHQLLCSSSLILRPPVKRGDIERLVTQSPPSNLAIVDGVFHTHPAVGHSEILNALGSGWRIWGLSSMGAIRACEMDTLGMTGFGEVYRQFASDPDMSDDEVTLIHQAQEPFLSLSEPLIHIRKFLRQWAIEQIITPAQEQHILHHLKNMWYGHRTLSCLKKALLALPVAAKQIDSALENFSAYRIKSLDLIDFLKLQPWTRTEK
ncbi:TfuA-like protein [Pseudomonas sp. BBP2017]|uniref:TfuA-like protein n=1 Tax=Pseudomonas sp. BBP2017 TaxID=2109731 RepID=UPI000D13DB0A|nr:TfuA-like protein [Pseudomonas sp. BBP2017]PSS57872.1 TfuA-related McrA-glycine thioamidation protein [Pseudomonas sp. BBP2017]